MRLKDLTGQKFNRWEVIERASNTKNGQARWYCVCDCGTKRVVVANSLLKNLSKSCGCHRVETALKMGRGNRKYGTENCHELRCWKNLKRRCLDKNQKAFKKYGGAGIEVCKEWLESYDNFLADMGKAPSEKHSIDRIDNDKGYCKENCRWADSRTQAINRKLQKSNTSGIAGVSRTYNSKWVARINGFNNERITLGTFADFLEACCARKSAEVKYGYLKIRSAQDGA